MWRRNRVTSSTDLIEMRDTLADERGELADAQDDASDAVEAEPDSQELIDAYNEAEAALTEWERENTDRLAALNTVCADGRETFSDWDEGIQLIAESDFPDHAREVASDIGCHTTDWPYNCIDWRDAANDLQVDYSSIEFEGVTYWGRSC